MLPKTEVFPVVEGALVVSALGTFIYYVNTFFDKFFDEFLTNFFNKFFDELF